MASRSALSRLSLTATRSMESARGATRYFSDDRGRVLSEEERAAENVYIKKMEKERSEKLKLKQENEKTEKENQGSDKGRIVVNGMRRGDGLIMRRWKWSVVRHRYLDVVKTAVLVTWIEFMHSIIILYEEMVGGVTLIS
ncbi:hypothetical protein POTOM_029066 [Populus tomentosa]|uniref:Uncharacterized protein n=1 Tax=Populus tomentosa TaxID=118781 RepID=A0A8X8CSX0_POPTO|nr:hypothetical protein POTOM_029066 [Populus tomentosa]